MTLIYYTLCQVFIDQSYSKDKDKEKYKGLQRKNNDMIVFRHFLGRELGLNVLQHIKFAYIYQCRDKNSL